MAAPPSRGLAKCREGSPGQTGGLKCTCPACKATALQDPRGPVPEGQSPRAQVSPAASGEELAQEPTPAEAVAQLLLPCTPQGQLPLRQLGGLYGTASRGPWEHRKWQDIRDAATAQPPREVALALETGLWEVIKPLYGARNMVMNVTLWGNILKITLACNKGKGR